MAETAGRLKRQLGTTGATLLGLGSIVGTGVFVSIGVAAGAAGPSVIAAIGAAALLAMCNALSSAQLAAAHSVSGGTYEYGYRFLTPTLGFLAGWMFLSAKSASSATAALGFAGYLLRMLGIGADSLLVWVGIAAVAVLTLIVLSGIRGSFVTNAVIVTVTLASLALFVAAAFVQLPQRAGENLRPFWPGASAGGALAGFLEGAALMFVAYTGYGRIATLVEEVVEPRRVIPRAIVITLIVSAALYICVGVAAVGTIGADALGEAAQTKAAPLEVAAETLDWGWLPALVAVGAMTAMLGVLLNLILGLSRVVLAMGRRGDLPRVFARVNAAGTTPWPAVILVGAVIGGLTAIGSVKTAWSFSAFTVLIYYALTNLAAIRLPRDHRLYWPVFPWAGLIGCLSLAFWVERRIWLIGLGLLGLGLLWHCTARRIQRGRSR